ncbi:hypothetical protein [Micromonospora okii]|uniref:hypothetical protein n=1 Tax=Micromonospora okii TaxID=1182970 RepID=UPI001E3BF6A3|nr:hypothetical protein [Micromonospora okii]
MTNNGNGEQQGQEGHPDQQGQQRGQGEDQEGQGRQRRSGDGGQGDRVPRSPESERRERHVSQGQWPSPESDQRDRSEPDVLLDVPNLRVGDLRLAVDGLEADLSLRARLATLLQLDAGVRVRLNAVELDIEDVRAELLLKVRLERLMEILGRAFTTIDRNPELLQSLGELAGQAVGGVGDSAQQVTGQTREAGKDQLVRDIASATARAEWSGAGAPSKAGETAGQATGGDGRQDQPQQQGQPRNQRGQGQQGAERGQPEQSQPDGAEPTPHPSEALRQAGRDLWDAVMAAMTQQSESFKRRNQ